MTISLGSVFVAWGIGYAGLGGFFFVASRRIPGRGHELFGAGLLGFGLLNFLRGAAQATPMPEIDFWVARATLTLAAFGGVLHTHFLALFFRYLRGLKHIWFGYAIALGATLADLVAASTLSPTEGSAGVHRPIAVFVTVVFALHLALGVGILYRLDARGTKLAKWPLWSIFAFGPLLVFDMVMGAVEGVDYFLGESVVWLYSLSIALVQLAELRGSEGLLERTTSSLAEKTAELQISYAEIELMSTELSRKEQLAAVGELAAAIAHEVRNPLAIIMNAGSGLRRRNLSESDRETLLSIVDEEALRLNQLVTELLRFARPVHAARAPTSLLDICARLREEAPESHPVVVENLTSGREMVLVDPGLFRLALDNLVDNARHSMPAGGTIHVVVRSGKLADGTTAIGVLVRDSGTGMTEDEVEKCRRPFFTTRPRGTGLGLSIAERIIEANGGEMLIESRPGVGTVVTLLVPFDSVAPSSRYPGTKAPSQRRRLRSAPSLAVDSRPSSSYGSRPKLASYGDEFEAPPPPSPERGGRKDSDG